MQIRSFFHGSESSAFHGSGFAAEDGRRIVTNSHVVAQAVLYPQQYQLEYLASDGRTGLLHVLAIDVPNDLAVVAADDLELPTLKLRTEIPAQGERAWSIGLPLDLGLTITEGVANGLVETASSSASTTLARSTAACRRARAGPAGPRVRCQRFPGHRPAARRIYRAGQHIPALLARAKDR